jgi:hypothetical protein
MSLPSFAEESVNFEPIEVHDFRPCGNEVLHKGRLCIVRPTDFGAQHILSVLRPDGAASSRHASFCVLHCPDRVVPRRVFVPIPRRATNMQIRVGCSREHDPRSRIADRRWQPAMLGIEGPKHHPMRADRYRRAVTVEGCVVAMLRGATEHVAKAWS